MLAAHYQGANRGRLRESYATRFSEKAITAESNWPAWMMIAGTAALDVGSRYPVPDVVPVALPGLCAGKSIVVAAWTAARWLPGTFWICAWLAEYRCTPRRHPHGTKEGRTGDRGDCGSETWPSNALFASQSFHLQPQGGPGLSEACAAMVPGAARVPPAKTQLQAFHRITLGRTWADSDGELVALGPGCALIVTGCAPILTLVCPGLFLGVPGTDLGRLGWRTSGRSGSGWTRRWWSRRSSSARGG